MNREDIKKALTGKVIEFHTVRPFAIERVYFYDTFIIVGGNGYCVPIDNEYLPTLIKYGAVEINHRTRSGETELINVYLK